MRRRVPRLAAHKRDCRKSFLPYGSRGPPVDPVTHHRPQQRRSLGAPLVSRSAGCHGSNTYGGCRVGVGRARVTGDRQEPCCSTRRLDRPCRDRPADRSLVAEDRSAGGVRDRTGPDPAVDLALVRAGSARHREATVPAGHERSRPVRRKCRSPHLPGQDLGEWCSEAAGSNPTSSAFP